MGARFAALAIGLALLGTASVADAQSTIKRPGLRPAYTTELEPHLLLGIFDPPGPGDEPGFGLGLRATFDVAPDGFIGPINDSVGIGVGLDVLDYDGRARGDCERFEPGPNGTRICTEVSGTGSPVYALLPVVMQWNFWLTRNWSVFGEPGLLFQVAEGDIDVSPFVLYAGGRFHFSDRVALTMRIGYPTFSLGVSFLM
ncbi:MAG: hypothetical protein DIU78_008765 [Pseudomonadota bacterium]|nr:MAG: hypothetical protein DIU78_20125 [Pseudomonadota bacterium]